ncbi:MAG: hypothetical protein HDT09_05515 [Bacteroidales bacterium]|nr:hypothetical protein [Bacteroidales bacterium]
MKLLPIFLSLFVICSCQTKREVPVPEFPEGDGVHIPRAPIVEKTGVPEAEPETGIHTPRPTIVDKSGAAIPKALAYRTSGNYNDNVFILMDASGKIVSYPAPSDVNASSAPLQLANGWLLDRRGIADNAAFLDYTWQQYHNLPAAPTAAQLKDHIIAGARVTQILVLPCTLAEAEADTATVNAIIAADTPTATLKK